MFGGSGRPVPTDIWWLLGVLFVTFSMQFFESVDIVPAQLRLTPAVRLGKLWQPISYAFIGTGNPSIWFLLEMFIVGMFGREIFQQLGRRRFWRLVLQVCITAAAVAVLVEWLSPWPAESAPFALMQGQYVVLTLLVAAFATIAGEQTILLFFVLPIQAKWFLLLELLFAFMGFLSTRDLAGFVGLVTAVGLTYSLLGGSRLGLLRETRLRIEHALFRLRLAWARKRRGLHVVKDDRPPKDPWVH